MEFLQSFSCDCGRTHECPVREVLIGHDVIREIPRLLSGLHRVLIISDANTRPLAIGELMDALSAGGILFSEVFFDQSDVLIPDEQSIDRIREAAIQDGICSFDALIGIGSGVINDLCKYISFLCEIPYMIIATAPSMDGFVSTSAAMIVDGVKTTINTPMPDTVILDTDVTIEPIFIRNYATSVSADTVKKLLVPRENGIRVTDRYGRVSGYQNIQALGAALEDVDSFRPTGYVCDAGVRSVWIDAFGNAKRCPAIGSTMFMGNILQGSFHLLEGPEVCSSDHCSCSQYGRIEKHPFR